MRTQRENPVYSRLGPSLAPGRRYPAEHSNIFWNVDERGRAREVEVVFIPRGGHIGVDAQGLQLWERYAAYIDRWSEDLGNSCDGWMQPDGLTPEQVFGHLLRIGFADKDAIIEALREFGGIAEVTWAQDMLSAFVDEEEVDVDEPPANSARTAPAAA